MADCPLPLFIYLGYGYSSTVRYEFPISSLARLRSASACWQRRSSDSAAWFPTVRTSLQAHIVVAAEPQMLLHLVLVASIGSSAAAVPVWRDMSQPAAKRAADMAQRMTLAQKAQSMAQQVGSFDMPDGSGTVPEIYNAECLHGPKAHGYTSTVFPSPIALAASFDRSLVHRMARATSDDLRSSWNEGKDWSYCFAPVSCCRLVGGFRFTQSATASTRCAAALRC